MQRGDVAPRPTPVQDQGVKIRKPQTDNKEMREFIKGQRKGIRDVSRHHGTASGRGSVCLAEGRSNSQLNTDMETPFLKTRQHKAEAK